jgi:hypothetical protein
MAFSSDMDLGLVFGLVGFVTAVLSALYARAQAVEARRQAEAAHLAAAIELNRSMNEHMLPRMQRRPNASRRVSRTGRASRFSARF